MSSTAIPSFTSLDWGRTGYADAWQRQEELVARRNVGGVGDTLVFTEHDPVYTLGVRKGAEQHMIWDEAELAKLPLEQQAKIRWDRSLELREEYKMGGFAAYLSFEKNKGKVRSWEQPPA